MKKISIKILVLFTFGILNVTPILASPYMWPSDGFVGYRFGDTTTYISPHTNPDGSLNNHFHNGIDIWSNANGGWNDGHSQSSNPVYAVSSGVVIWIGGGGLIIRNSDEKYSNYWHVRNLQVSIGQSVNTSTVLGYQDNDVVVHVHVTLSTTASDAGHIDPTPYFETNGYSLHVGNSNLMPWGTRIQRDTDSCEVDEAVLTNLNIPNGATFNCGSDIVTTIRNSTFMHGSNVRLYNY